MDQESTRAVDFDLQLRRIEYQSARLAGNRNYDLSQGTTRDLLRDKSLDLMSGIVKFFNCALLYYNQTFFGIIRCFCKLIMLVNLLKSVGGGAKAYEDGKRALDLSISEYDQAVMDLTATLVTSISIQISGNF